MIQPYSGVGCTITLHAYISCNIVLLIVLFINGILLFTGKSKFYHDGKTNIGRKRRVHIHKNNSQLYQITEITTKNKKQYYYKRYN